MQETINSLEQYCALKSPMMEAELALDDKSALSLYDCLIPKIKEHRRFAITKDAVFSVADFKT